MSCSPCCPTCPPPPPPKCCRCPVPQTQALTMRPGCPGKNATPFNFATKTLNQPMENVCIVPPSCTTRDGTKMTEISDPGKEMFVMRIAKKSQGGCEERNHIDMELTTPRPLHLPPPPEMEHRRVQYDPKDFGETEKKAKGAKGGKGKGGKKKKK